MRLIDAEYLLHKASIAFNTSHATLGEEAILWRFQSLIEDAPTEQVEQVKHGRWIADLLKTLPDIDPYGTIICSVCGWKQPAFETKYCCNCGARMDGGAHRADD